MKTLLRTTQFKNDLRRMQKRGKEFSVLKNLIESLQNNISLETKFRDNTLIGNYQCTREFHIEPDWLLLYESSENEIILIRTGTHSDLFQ